jgi:multimeric flavodoxin WrbA
MASIKRKMEDADFLILGTPVHTSHMSGQMKTFFDRLAAWYHMVKLAGKPGLTVVTTGSVHQDELHHFMGTLMGTLGIKVVATMDAVAFIPGVFLDKEAAERSAEKAALMIAPYVTGEKRVETDETVEKCFLRIKNKVISGKKWLAGYRHWEKEGMLEMGSYRELIEKMD